MPLVFLVLAVGLVLSLLAAWLAARAENERLWLEFQRDSTHKAAAIERLISASIEHSQTLADFLATNPEVSAEDFRRYVLPAMQRQPQLQGESWAVVLRHEDAPAFEAKMRAAGFPDFTLHHRDAGGNNLPLGPGPIHTVNKYVAPDSRISSLGYDTYSSPRRRAAMDRARDTGRPAATAPVRLLADETRQPAMVIYTPVYKGGVTPNTVEERREKLIGFAGTGLRLHDLVAQALSYIDVPLIRATLHDVTDGEVGRPLSWFPLGMEPGEEPPIPSEDLQLDHEFDVAGRRWRVSTVALPDFFRGDLPRRTLPSLVFAAGAMISVLVAMALWALLRHAALQRRLAIERAETNRELEARFVEKEEAERELSRTNRELHELNRDMEQFVSAVSHDLKNPIVAVEWMVASLERSLKSGKTEAACDAMANIRQACGSMKRLISDVLTHSRAGFAAYEPQPVDLDEVVRDVLVEREGEIKRRHAEVEVNGPLPVVEGDRNRLTAVFDNLLGNALKYGAVGDQPPRIEIGAVWGEGEVRLYVRDHGPGIPPDQHREVFKLFHRLAADEEGTGIGLAIVARIARVHRGRAWVESELGKGATFYLSLPQSAAVREPVGRV